MWIILRLVTESSYISCWLGIIYHINIAHKCIYRFHCDCWVFLLLYTTNYNGTLIQLYFNNVYLVHPSLIQLLSASTLSNQRGCPIHVIVHITVEPEHLSNLSDLLLTLRQNMTLIELNEIIFDACKMFCHQAHVI